MPTPPPQPRAYLDQPAAGRLTISYAPADGAAAMENPPRFTWLPVVEEEARYTLRLSRNPEFPEGETVMFTDLDLNFLTPDRVLEPGMWHWSYAVWNNGPATEWSVARRVEVAADLPLSPLPARDARYAATAHPRLWLQPGTLAVFRAAVAENTAHCGWNRFFEASVRPWMDCPVMAEPAPYPDNTRTAPIWRSTYIACQELIYAIRGLAIGGQVTGDPVLTARAKDWLLAAAAWDPTGITSRAYTDEWAFRVTVALAWGYDWLHDALTEEERAAVREALRIRTKEIADHIILNARIHLFPFDSHAVRAVSAVLVPAAIALLDEVPEARGWLDYATEFLFTVYSPWGDAEGGWAEGPHYWMTGMAYLLEAGSALRSFAGIDLFARPFFHRTADFPLFTKPPDIRRATFGDDSTMGDLPGLKLGHNLRHYAAITGNGTYQWYHEVLKANDPGTAGAFYNYGWWDLAFDDLCLSHDFPPVAAVPPDLSDRLRWFRGIGWAAVQLRMNDPSQHMHLVMKSSSYGSVSHSHGDQNAFCLSAFGEDLAIQSGHYVAFNSAMHQDWRRQTRSKNAILIDGKGQYAGKDKAQAIRAAGRLTHVEDRGDHIFIRGDATEAYRSLSPDVEGAIREVHVVHDEYLVIVDSVDAARPVTVDWLLHANQPFDLGAASFRTSGVKAGFYGQVVWSESGPPVLSQVTGFPGVPPEEYAGLDESTCLTARYPSAVRHRIVTLLVPYPVNDPRRIFHFVDDQGYDCDVYFTDAEERSFRLVVQKLART